MALTKEELLVKLSRLEWSLEADIEAIEQLTKAMIKENLMSTLLNVQRIRGEVMKPRHRRANGEIQKTDGQEAQSEDVQPDG